MVTISEPRERIWALMKDGVITPLLEEAVRLHGHFCPGLSLGVLAAYEGLKNWDSQSVGLEGILAIVETNNCFTDGIQYVSGCTFGNNSLIYRDYGKTAVTFTGRDGKGIRIGVKPNARDQWSDKFPRYGELFDSVIKKSNREPEQVQEFKTLSRQLSFYLLEIDPSKILENMKVSVQVPDYAPIQESVTCSECKESVMASKMIEARGGLLCKPCAKSKYYELNGGGIELKGGNHE